MDEELLAVGGDDAALVDDRVLLQGAVEVVAEGAVRLRSAQVLPIRLDQQAVADLEVGDLGADRDHADDRLMAGDRGSAARAVVRDLRERLGGDAGDDLALARVVVELVQQFRVGEADAARLHFEEQLGGADPVDGLGGVDLELVDSCDLDRVLGFRDLSHVFFLVVRGSAELAVARSGRARGGVPTGRARSRDVRGPAPPGGAVRRA